MNYREKKNLDVRAFAKERKVTLAEVAAEMNISVSVLSIELRKELSGADKAELFYAIRNIAERKGKENERKGIPKG